MTLTATTSPSPLLQTRRRQLRRQCNEPTTTTSRRTRHRTTLAMTLLATVAATFFAASAFTDSSCWMVTAFTSPSDLPIKSTQSITTSGTGPAGPGNRPVSLDKLRQDWADRSVSYYSKIMREERRRNTGQLDATVATSEEYQQDFQVLAKKHYFALRKIKDGQYTQAETIYKRIIDEILNENSNERCDHAKLAVTTLLLALHCQRMGDIRKTRSVFLSFFRTVTMDNSHHHHDEHDDVDAEHPQCACSAKVLGAFALFEMKQGNAFKSLQIARKAVEFDPAMEPVLQWKQFREVGQRQRQQQPASDNQLRP